MKIDTRFDVYSDTHAGKDPDAFSPRLRAFHRHLWSKALPDGTDFVLTDATPGVYLHHKSPLGEFSLASDAITHTYQNTKSTADIISRIPTDDTREFFRLCSTIGAYTIFPGNRVDRKMTLNGARGLNPKIGDRFDLTLECIRRHYENVSSPLTDVLARYGAFFGLFRDFRGYVDFFLFQDLVEPDFRQVRFWLPFEDFATPPVPRAVEDYLRYREKVCAFVRARNCRITESQVAG